MNSKRLIGLGLVLGLLCPLCSLALDSDVVVLTGFVGMFVVGLMLQTVAGLRAWRCGSSSVAPVGRATLLYWVAASIGFGAGGILVFTSLFGGDPPAGLLLEQRLIGLPMLWTAGGVCGAVVVGVTTAARAVSAR